MDYRASLQEVIAGKAIKKFFANVDESRVFLALNHCDFQMPTPDFIGRKLASIREYSGLGIPQSNVILFSKTKESLEPLIPKLKPGSCMHFVENLEQMAAEIYDDLPKDFARQDKTEGKLHNRSIPLGTQHLEMFKIMAEMMKDSNAQMVQAMTASSQQMTQISSTLVSQGSSGGGGGGLGAEIVKGGFGLATAIVTKAS